MKVKTPEGDILEMSVISRDWVSDGEFADLPVLGSKVWSVSCVVGGHIQSIVGTECSSLESAECALRDLAGDLSSGEGELGTTNGKPYVKRSWSLFQHAYANREEQLRERHQATCDRILLHQKHIAVLQNALLEREVMEIEEEMRDLGMTV